MDLFVRWHPRKHRLTLAAPLNISSYSNDSLYDFEVSKEFSKKAFELFLLASASYRDRQHEHARIVCTLFTWCQASAGIERTVPMCEAFWTAFNPSTSNSRNKELLWHNTEILQPGFPLTISLMMEPVLGVRTFLFILGSYNPKYLRISTKVRQARLLYRVLYFRYIN
jgi:hypothetical protein